MRRLTATVFSLLALCCTTMQAQNSEITKASELMDQNKLSEAWQTIKEAIDNPKTTDSVKAFRVAGDISARMLNMEIFNASKREPFDTARFVVALDNAVKYYKESYVLDQLPDKKGKVKPKYGEDTRKQIINVLPYYAYAGQFLYSNGNLSGAYDAFSKFVSMPSDPIFEKSQTDSMYEAGRSNYSEVAYYATMLAYNQKNWDNVLKEVDFALADTANLNDLYLMKLTALLDKGDTAQWVVVSKEAVKRVPNSLTFPQNLLAYYIMKDDSVTALEMGNDLVQNAPDAAMSWYARGSVYLNMYNNYPKARADFEKAVELNPAFPEAEANIGISYINEVVSMKDQFTNNQNSPKYKSDRETVLGYYRKAKPHSEKARELAPDKPRLWAISLSNIYYNLEEKDKEKEITEIINTMTAK